MAVAFQEVITNSSGSGTSLTASGFASLAVGDLMVAHFAYNKNATTTPPAGWTQINLVQNAAPFSSYVGYKIAAAGDVSGNSFQFTQNGTAGAMALAIYRITGHRNVSIPASSSGQFNASSATVTAPTVTPTLANSLIILLAANAGGSTTSTYAIATSSPTFTERHDVVSGTVGIAGATGLRPEITATGSGTATISAAANIGQLVVISPSQDGSQVDTVATTDSVRADIGGYVRDTVTTSELISSTIARAWTNLARNVKTWTNQNKD